MMQLIFFAVSIVVLFAGHVLFWFLFVRLFGLASFNSRLIAALIIFFFFLSTVLASYLIHKWDRLLTRWYYIISAAWIGLLANLAVVALFLLLVYLGGLMFGYSLPILFYRLTFLLGAAGLTLFGLAQAWAPKVTSYDVFIKDLPAQWEGKTIVQISDVHLGPVYREHFLARTLAKVQSLDPQAVFITGDLFDGMESDFSWLHEPFQNLKAPAGIFYSFGNHDLYLGFKRAISFLADSPVQVLDDKMVVIDGLQIIGINYSFNKDFDLEEAILRQVGYDKKKPSILLFHEPKNIELAKTAEIDLQLSGHTHNGQVWPFNYLAKLMYKGYGFGHYVIGDFNLVVSRGVGTWGPPIRTSGASEIVKITLRKK